MATDPSTIETSYINSFKSGLEHAYQQTTSDLAPYVQNVRQAAEFDFYDRIGVAEDLTENVTRYGDNPMTEIPHDRRRIGLRDFETGKAVEPKDLVRVSSDPTNEYTTAMVAAANRKKDDIIVERMFGPAYTGKKGDTVISFAGTNTGNITLGAISKGTFVTGGRYTVEAGTTTEGVDVATGYSGTGVTTDTGITLAKLKGIRRTLMGLQAIKQDTVLNCFITAYQFNELLGISEIINSDYAIRKALAEGQVTTFMGFRFIHAERLKVVSGVRQCMVLLPNAFKMAVSKDITVDMWRLTAKKNIPYTYLSMGMDGTRMWGEATVKLNCVEA
jgi:hypothetical protein